MTLAALVMILAFRLCVGKSNQCRGGAFRAETPSAGPAGIKPPLCEGQDIDAKIARLGKRGTPVTEAIRLLGEPSEYFWGRRSFRKHNLPRTYIMQYPAGVAVVIRDGVIAELRSESPGPGFTWRGRLHLGSLLKEVLEAVGPPPTTVIGGPLAFADGVLYKNINGKKGYCYYGRSDQDVRCFFRHGRVTALYWDLGFTEQSASLAMTEDAQR
jgi:hypothetical protein